MNSTLKHAARKGFNQVELHDDAWTSTTLFDLHERKTPSGRGTGTVEASYYWNGQLRHGVFDGDLEVTKTWD